MFPLFETIYLENGVIRNIDYHQRRIEKSGLELFGMKPLLDLNLQIFGSLRNEKGKFRIRISYNDKSYHFQVFEYFGRDIRSLKLVYNNNIEYPHKFEDRSQLEELTKQKEECDDILIVKNGFITDTSFSNIVFCDGQDWFTPNTPLLQGTARAYLLDNGIIKEKTIQPHNLSQYQSFKLINAIRHFEITPEISCKNIIM